MLAAFVTCALGFSCGTAVNNSMLILSLARNKTKKNDTHQTIEPSVSVSFRFFFIYCTKCLPEIMIQVFVFTFDLKELYVLTKIKIKNTEKKRDTRKSCNYSITIAAIVQEA